MVKWEPVITRSVAMSQDRDPGFRSRPRPSSRCVFSVLLSLLSLLLLQIPPPSAPVQTDSPPSPPVSERPSSVPPALLTALRRRPSPSSLSARVPWIDVHRSLRASPSHHRSSRRPSPVLPPSPVAPIQHLALSASPHPIQPYPSGRPSHRPPLPIPILFFLLSPSSVASTVIPCR